MTNSTSSLRRLGGGGDRKERKKGRNLIGVVTSKRLIHCYDKRHFILEKDWENMKLNKLKRQTLES